jgi:hypothetical protein
MVFPVGSDVRINGSELWRKRERPLIGLCGKVRWVLANGDYTVSARVDLYENKFGRKWTIVNVSWLEKVTALDLLAQV